MNQRSQKRFKQPQSGVDIRPVEKGSGLNDQFWTRMRQIQSRIEQNTTALLDIARSPQRSRLRTALEIAGFTIGIAALVAAIYGNVQNSITISQNSKSIALNTESLKGLRDSLEREQISSVFLLAGGPCTDDQGKLVGGIYQTVLTNVGRLPITVVHIGDRGTTPYNDFAWARVEDPNPTAQHGPFYLDVGQAVEISYASSEKKFGGSVLVTLSNGKAVDTKIITTGNDDWLATEDAGQAALASSNVQCVRGQDKGVPLKDFVDGTPFPFPQLGN